MSASTPFARPSTPFPHTHILHHGHQSSRFEPHAYTAQPLHFHMQRLPQPTPPSLLQRQASLKHTANAVPSSPPRVPFTAPSSPSRAATSLPIPIGASSVHSPTSARPHSSCPGSPLATSSSSTPSPSTPLLEPFPLFSLSTPFELPSPVSELEPHLASPLTSTLHSEEDRDDVEVDFGRPSMEEWERCWELEGEGRTQCVRGLAAISRSARQPQKPVLRRKGTPRPQDTIVFESLPMSGVGSWEAEERRVLRSAIDGGRWEILA